MSKSTEERLSALEKLVEPFVQRQVDIQQTERKILAIVRQLARLKCGGYYVSDDGCRYLTWDKATVSSFQFALDGEISKLGIDLMGTDKP